MYPITGSSCPSGSSHILTMCSQSSGGILALSFEFPSPCVPVLEPLGAATWHGEPGLQAGLNLGLGWLVHMSVGFCLVSPYWQYVTVYRGIPFMNLMVRSPALGFSMKKYLGWSSRIMSIQCAFVMSQNLA